MTNSTPNSDLIPSDSVFAWRRRYERLGLRTIPLIGKAPATRLSWTSSDADALWQSVGDNFEGNIGILLGEGLAVVDADDIDTGRSVADGLDSLGILPLAVQTPHGMHFYLRTQDMPVTYHSCLLPPELGIGELRGGTTYVVAPLSQVDGIFYRWVNGTPEDLASQPVVQWRDLSWLLPEQPTYPLIEALPIRPLHRDMPAKARSLLKQLVEAPKGKPIGPYRSRSEAEAAVISMLILAGWPYNEILSTFDKSRPGKYWETRGRDRLRYFDRTYHGALSRISAHPTRAAVASCWQMVSANPLWRGNNGYIKRDTLLALLAICWQFGSWEVFAPQRALGEYAAASQFCVSKTLRALCSDGLIERLNSVRDPGDADHWRVNILGSLSSQAMICDNFSRAEEWDLNELWAASALGRSAGTIYGLLSSTPVTISWLSRQTGKAWSTVDAALDRLAHCGLSTKVQKGWIRGARVLREVAEEFDTKTRACRRRELHIGERERFAERLGQLNQCRNADRLSR